MRALRLHGYGDVDQLSVETVPDPVPGEGEVLIELVASSLNPVETYIRLGHMTATMPLDLPATLGIDAAGTIKALGPGVMDFTPGERVVAKLAVNGGGSHADLAVATLNQIARLPRGVSFVAGATLPLAGLTGRQAVNALGVSPGDRVLVTGALGSVGRAAVQYLQELGAVPVAGVRPHQLEEARTLTGEALVAGEEGEAHSFAGVVDAVGGSVAAHSIDLVRDGGMLAALVGVPEGVNADERIRVAPIFAVEDAAMLDHIVGAAARGELTLPVAATFPLDDIVDGYKLLADHPGGKVVITR